MSLNLIKCYQTQGYWYKQAGTGVPVGVCWHDTGAGNPYLKRYVQPSTNDSQYNQLLKLIGKNSYNNDWNRSSFTSAGLNAWIGKLADDTVATIQAGPWNKRAWGVGRGSKGSLNGSGTGDKFWIQFEICDDYAGGQTASKAYFTEAYNQAVALTAYLCKLYGFDPYGYVTYKGVQVPTITCHADSYKLGLGGNHSDVYGWFNRFGKTMNDVRNDVAALMKASATTDTGTTTGSSTENASGYTKIVSNAVASTEQMTAYIKAKNPSVAQSVIDMIPLYLSEGKTEGVAGDIAFAQSCLETGNFGFSGSAVTLDQNNFCGMGVTSNGMKGNSFNTPQLGIRAQIQHLKAYGSTADLVNECIDPRFKYVTRGSAEYVEWLGMKENPNGKGWASGAGYGEKILAILKAVRQTKVSSTNTSTNTSTTASTTSSVKVGDLVSITSGAKYYTGADIPNWVENKKWYVKSISGDRVVIDKSADGKNAICSPIHVKYLTVVGAAAASSTPAETSYRVKVETSYLNIRKGPGTDYARTGAFTGAGVFTIVETRSGTGSKSGWGKLKSGAGWISLDYTKRV